MRLTFFTIILFCFLLNESSGQITTVYDILVKDAPPTLGPVCISPCRECGKLIFTTGLSDLEFISDMKNIYDKPEIDRRINADGNQIFIYKITTKALPSQAIRIRGPIIKDYILLVSELNVGECLYFIINVGGDPTPPPKPIIEIQKEIKRYSYRQTFWLGSTILSAGAGGYFMYESNQKYSEYLSATGSNASQIRETYELYDKLGPAFLGLAGVCALEFTIQTIKKGKSKEKLKLYANGKGVTLTYKF